MLAGVLAVTVIALVAFDFAAVGALRRYLLGHTDAQLQTVLSLYRPMTITLPGSANWIYGRRRRGRPGHCSGRAPPAGAARRTTADRAGHGRRPGGRASSR